MSTNTVLPAVYIIMLNIKTKHLLWKGSFLVVLRLKIGSTGN